MKKIILSILMVCLFPIVSTASDQSFKNSEEFGDWVSNYYKEPSVQRVLPAFHYFGRPEVFKRSSMIPLSFFFSSIFKKQPELLKPFFESMKSERSKEKLYMAIMTLILTDSDESNKLLEKIDLTWQLDRVMVESVQRGLKENIPDILDKPVDNPVMLDVMWAIFSATGEEKPIKRIISILHLEKNGKAKEVVLAGAARWSLGSKMKQDKRVLEIAERHVHEIDGINKKILLEVIESVKQ